MPQPADLPTAPASPEPLPTPWQNEAAVASALRTRLAHTLDWSAVRAQCEPWVTQVRAHPPAFWAMDALLQAYPLSHPEGLALMRLAEALLRVPDADTRALLLTDQLQHGDFTHHQAASGARSHPWLEALSARMLGLAQQVMRPAQTNGDNQVWRTLLGHLGQDSVVSATLHALQLLGRQFVLAPDIARAWQIAEATTRADERMGWQTTWSFDMLGEGARTWADADRYLAAYQHALATLSDQTPATPEDWPVSRRQGLSIKLSALHPRFEQAHQAQVIRELGPRLLPLARSAAEHGLLLTIDAEESARLALQLAVLVDLLDRLRTCPPATRWPGLGLAIQAYQYRAPAMIQVVSRLAAQHQRRLTVRLVKGAYWDAEIKQAQEAGLPGYPVYTHKPHTDLSYLACAQDLLRQRTLLFPQFATHNASTMAGVSQLVQHHGLGPTEWEWQRLHGMGESLYQAMRQTTAAAQSASVRVYAPVGPHRDLLAYLVRRLLENGANASFVHQLAAPDVALDTLLASPLADTGASPCTLAPPLEREGLEHRQAAGRDLHHTPHREALLTAIAQRQRDAMSATATTQASSSESAGKDTRPIDTLMRDLDSAWPAWEATELTQRCAMILRAADDMEAKLDSWAADLVVEARKTLPDAVSEVREAIDYARYYAAQARDTLASRLLAGPTGEHNEWRARGRGVFVCIAPWNFPLAIFAGQVIAALLAGNVVAAKPAEQTPQVARKLVALLHRHGIPVDALCCVCGPGSVGAELVAHPLCAGVAFTGSVATAKHIQRSLAEVDRPIVPLIAETGGLNAMIVDSTALPEQVIDTVLASAFLSAGQRCSALRLLCLHQAVADDMACMLAGALLTLVSGPPADWSTDVGPVIDPQAQARLLNHLAALAEQAQDPSSGVHLIGQAPPPADPGELPFVRASAWRIPRVSHLQAEHFGPILHIVQWGPGTHAPTLDDLIDQINASGYGLTLGLHTRMGERIQHVSARARVGNVYVNRSMTGAVVGVQPFGGQGWSGTGPKAGGPLYVLRFATEQVLSVNTTAAGGNAALLTQFSC